ncbi:MAG: hypothetical protein K6E30_01125 [Lachnospiraceae bacterium]|nr:hypothetical protein [Lachnospiraceae bacterium]
MWAYENVFYQIYPIGLTGAPRRNDGIAGKRLSRISRMIPHLKKLGIGAVMFNPLFESEGHGYDTIDMRRVDTRLGTNDELKDLVASFHAAGIRVMLDAVFNHVGRGFFAFEDVQKNRQSSPYCSWFNISFDGNSVYNDGFWYEGWEGHYELVKLNLYNPEVRRYLVDSALFWIREFDIDALRLDVAYLLNHDFIRQLKYETNAEKPDFFLLGEALFGDYNLLMKDGMLDSVTNYECYKGIYSSINSRNFFEISYSYNRQFGSEPWCIYQGRHLFSFVDNHDVTRIIDQLSDERNLRIAYGLLFSMPGIPCLYYGSEWGIHGKKEDGDHALRPSVERPKWNELTDFLAELCRVRAEETALSYGGYRNMQVTNSQLAFMRECNGGKIFAFFNLDDQAFSFQGDYLHGTFENLVDRKCLELHGSLAVDAREFVLLKLR